jgi:hypothetical protein
MGILHSYAQRGCLLRVHIMCHHGMLSFLLVCGSGIDGTVHSYAQCLCAAGFTQELDGWRKAIFCSIVRAACGYKIEDCFFQKITKSWKTPTINPRKAPTKIKMYSSSSNAG